VRWDPDDEELKKRFVQFLRNKRRPVRDERNMLRYLNRYMPPEGLAKLKGIFDMFMSCEHGRHHLDKAFRNFLNLSSNSAFRNFYRRVLGYPRDFIEALKEAIPTARGDFEDKWVSGEDLIISSRA